MTIPTITALPTVPSYDNTNFESLAPAFLSFLKNTFQAEMNAAIAAINAYDYGAAVNASIITGQVAVANGGTGLSELAAGRIPYGAGTAAFASQAFLRAKEITGGTVVQLTQDTVIAYRTGQLGGAQKWVARIPVGTAPTVGRGGRAIMRMSSNSGNYTALSRPSIIETEILYQFQSIGTRYEVVRQKGDFPTGAPEGAMGALFPKYDSGYLYFGTAGGHNFNFISFEFIGRDSKGYEIEFIDEDATADSPAVISPLYSFDAIPSVVKFGLGTTAPAKKLEVKDDSGAQLRLTDSAGNYVDFRADGDGNLDIIPSGGEASVSGDLRVDGFAQVDSYTVATLPSASTAGAGAMIYVTDDVGGAVIAFSDGTNWRRMTDRAVISTT